jgi:tetratricopeptide (TPR) repeat protein
LTDALNTARSSRGPDDLATCDALNALAHLYDARGRYPLAEPLFREALASLRRISNPSPVLFHAAFINCAVNLLRQNKKAEAEPILKEYLETAEERGWKDIRIGIARSQLGEVLMTLMRYSEAEPLLLVGFDEIRARAAEISAAAGRARLAEAAQRLARYYGVIGKPDEAAKWQHKYQELLKP